MDRWTTDVLCVGNNREQRGARLQCTMTKLGLDEKKTCINYKDKQLQYNCNCKCNFTLTATIATTTTVYQYTTSYTVKKTEANRAFVKSVVFKNYTTAIMDSIGQNRAPPVILLLSKKVLKITKYVFAHLKEE